jgi:anionic cell wall polymer biosynthesis LytR-Cps2A-Psr (LCP) family protein
MVVQQNFQMKMDYYMRLRFEGFRDIVNAMGGLDIELNEPRAGYEPGKYHLTGNKALAFARQRLGSDDFFRMENGQFLVREMIAEMQRPVKWVRLPAVLLAFSRNLDTDVPTWLWPRLGFILLRLGSERIVSRTIPRELAAPITTADGAQVLSPDWEGILPLVKEVLAP